MSMLRSRPVALALAAGTGIVGAAAITLSVAQAGHEANGDGE